MSLTITLDLHDAPAVEQAIRMLQAAICNVSTTKTTIDPNQGEPITEAEFAASIAASNPPSEMFDAPKPPSGAAYVSPSTTPVITALAPTPNATPALAPAAPAPVPTATGGDTTLLTPATPATGGALIDSKGMPWDPRINNPGKTTMKDGSWKLRVTPKEYADKETWMAYVETVRAELKGVMAATPAPSAAGHPPTPTIPAQAPAPVAPAAEWNFATLAQAVTSRQVPEDVVNQAISVVSQGAINSFALLGSRQDLVPMVALQLNLGA